MSFEKFYNKLEDVYLLILRHYSLVSFVIAPFITFVVSVIILYNRDYSISATIGNSLLLAVFMAPLMVFSVIIMYWVFNILLVVIEEMIELAKSTIESIGDDIGRIKKLHSL